MTNLRHNLQNKLAQYRGELEAARAEVDAIETGITHLPVLRRQIDRLEEVIKASETVLKHEYPDFRPGKIKPVRPRAWKSPLKPGDIGRTALGVLRETGDWLRPREVARIMLEQIGRDPDDRPTREKLTNSVAAYLKSHKDELVESRGNYAREWRVIR